MQHGSARPLAVKYITVQGRRHSDQGFASALRARLSPGSVAPEALKLMPSAAACALRRLEVVRRPPASGARTGPGPGVAMPIGVVLEEHQPLQVDLLHADLVGDAHEVGKLGDGLLEARQPQRDARALQALARLHLGEGAHVAHDAVEVVLAADQQEGAGVGGIERDAQLVEAGLATSSRPFLAVSTVPLVLNST